MSDKKCHHQVGDPEEGTEDVLVRIADALALEGEEALDDVEVLILDVLGELYTMVQQLSAFLSTIVSSEPQETGQWDNGSTSTM